MLSVIIDFFTDLCHSVLTMHKAEIFFCVIKNSRMSAVTEQIKPLKSACNGDVHIGLRGFFKRNTWVKLINSYYHISVF